MSAGLRIELFPEQQHFALSIKANHRFNLAMLKNSLTAFAVVALAVSPITSIAAPVDAQPMTNHEVTELTVDASTEQSAVAESEEGGILGSLGGLITLAASAAILYYVYKDNN